jgi:hypothetical protein
MDALHAAGNLVHAQFLTHAQQLSACSSVAFHLNFLFAASAVAAAVAAAAIGPALQLSSLQHLGV